MEERKIGLEKYPQLLDKVYCRGFLLTDDYTKANSLISKYKWNHFTTNKIHIFVHPKQHYYWKHNTKDSVILIGHAYNPFTLDYEEDAILEKCLQILETGIEKLWEYFNQLTGIFALFIVSQNTVKVIGDPSGMQTVFYSCHNDHIYVASHTMLIGEILKLEKDQYSEKLINYRFFPLLGNSLPGDRTQFADLKRVTPNFCYVYEKGEFRKYRFFIPYQVKNKTRKQLAEEAGEILHKSLELVSKKWDRPAISLTGGCDSKTTLACANGLYEKFQYFSYFSSDAEKVDCDAARSICKSLNLEHKVYMIPEAIESVDEYDEVKKILKWNCGNILDSNANDIRKRIILDKEADYDVEIKSWASEIGRAYYSKRFNGRTSFPKKPTGRLCTTLYKFFLYDRKLVRETDEVFNEFITEYMNESDIQLSPWVDQFFWEFRVPSWNGLVISGEHSYTSDIDIPYNNRLLLTILLSVPIEDRLNDSLYKEIRDIWNPKIDQTGISITNLHHTKSRSFFENLYWVIHSHFPF